MLLQYFMYCWNIRKLLHMMEKNSSESCETSVGVSQPTEVTGQIEAASSEFSKSESDWSDDRGSDSEDD